MADVVQIRLERMLPSLDDLEKRGLFTRPELDRVVTRRRDFEYRLKRPSPLKEDFLAFIEYEKGLERLRRLRKKAQARELKEKGNKRMKRSKSDFAGISKIVEIYRLATNRFKGDVELWFQYLEFCRKWSKGRMKKVLAEVVRFHPKVSGVWIYAAAWEFDENLNVTAARALMQSGLRACPTSEDIWVEYLRMELTYLNKLKARKVALGEDKGTLIREDEKEWRDENKELFMSLNEKRENLEASDVPIEEAKKKGDLFREQGLAILRTVYDGAVEALPSSFSLRTQFLEVLKATDLANSEEMEQHILEDMRKKFSKEPEYWDWLARLEVAGLVSNQEMSKGIKSNQLSKAIQVYEEALETIPSPEMFSLYAKFCMDAIAHKDGQTDDSLCFDPSGNNKDLTTHILRIYEKAESMGCISEDLACQHVSLLLQLRRSDEARKLSEELCNGKLSDAVQLWVLRLSIDMRSVGTVSKADLQTIFDLLRIVLNKVSISKAESIWLMAFKYFANQSHYFDKLVELSMSLLLKDGGSDDGFSLPSVIVNFLVQRSGIQSARDMYNRFLALPRPGLAFYRNCIELEVNLASAGDKSCLAKARKLYEAALATYDKDPSLWKEYYSMECKMGTSETAAAVHWRARKILGGNVAFLVSRDV